jgi:hypothetical protein
VIAGVPGSESVVCVGQSYAMALIQWALTLLCLLGSFQVSEVTVNHLLRAALLASAGGARADEEGGAQERLRASKARSAGVAHNSMAWRPAGLAVTHPRVLAAE